MLIKVLIWIACTWDSDCIVSIIHRVLYISTSIWVLRTPNAVKIFIFSIFCAKKLLKMQKKWQIWYKKRFFKFAPKRWSSVLFHKKRSYKRFPMWGKHLIDLLKYGLFPMWAKRILGYLYFTTKFSQYLDGYCIGVTFLSWFVLWSSLKLPN